MRIILHKWKYLLSLSVLWVTHIIEAQQLTHQVTLNVNDVEITEVNSYDMVHLHGGVIPA